MLDKSLIDKIKAMPIDRAITMGDGVLTREDKAAIEAAYFSVKGKRIKRCSCKHRYADALLEVITELKIKPKRKMSKYEMRAGCLIWLDNNPLTAANITDKLAARWCKLHPERVADIFSRYPESLKTDSDESEDNTEVAEEI